MGYSSMIRQQVGGFLKIKFWNFKLPMHMGVPQACRNTFYFIGTSLIFKFCPSLSQKTTLQTAQKPKGGPLDEKILFFKNVLRSFSNVVQLTTFTALIPKTYISWDQVPSKLVHAPCTLCKACTERARALQCAQTPCYVCFWNQHNKCSHLNHV